MSPCQRRSAYDISFNATALIVGVIKGTRVTTRATIEDLM
jgi:hypothetical protein